jgi:hypothetical protein
MRMIPLLTTVGLGLLLVAGISPAAAEDLFNGKDLDGRRAYAVTHSASLADVWSVRDGAIACKGDPMGYLYTAKDYKNFKLTVEYRWPGKPGNSGLFLRLNGKPGFLPRTVECQLQNGSAGDLYGFLGMKIGGDPARVRTIQNKDFGALLNVKAMSYNEKKPGEWNTVEVVVNGPSVKVTVNDKLVNEATDCEVIAGPIGLQSEGGEIHFRKVLVTPLPD